MQGGRNCKAAEIAGRQKLQGGRNCRAAEITRRQKLQGSRTAKQKYWKRTEGKDSRTGKDQNWKKQRKYRGNTKENRKRVDFSSIGRNNRY